MAEGSESMERGQHVSFEYERHLDTPVYHFGVTMPRNWKAENVWIIHDLWFPEKWEASMACFGCTDARMNSTDLLDGVSS